MMQNYNMAIKMNILKVYINILEQIGRKSKDKKKLLIIVEW